MSKSISVRVSRTKLIASLGSAIAKLNAEKDNRAQDKKLRDKWEVRFKRIPLTTYARLSYKSEMEIDDSPWREGQDAIKVTVSYYIKKGVAMDRLSYVEAVNENYRNDTIIEEIGQAIRLLELSDEDTVNTATYRSVTQYL
jgi:hypothetical protein